MSFYILFKTTCRVNQRVYYGIHKTMDIFFGTTESSDPYVGDTTDINEDLSKYGRKAFIVETIHAYDDETKAHVALRDIKKKLPPNAYNTNYAACKMGNEYALGVVRSDETKARMSAAVLGDKNAFYGKKHNDATKEVLSEYRKQMKWITDGSAEQQIVKGDAIPDGWKLGRKPRRSALEVIAAGNANVIAAGNANPNTAASLDRL